MSKKKGNNSSKKQQNNGVLNHQPIALGLIRGTFPELFSNVLDAKLALMVSEEKAKREAECRKRWKE